ncbi:hypothetical protein V6N11_082368 [Hibiscus sabdariffa]|uniref:Uncharacterized protein n=1 Tax=Hibiscus sabdariffa TaxID=183260 RepID=A0ABR2PCD7_9ROSI
MISQYPVNFLVFSLLLLQFTIFDDLLFDRCFDVVEYPSQETWTVSTSSIGLDFEEKRLQVGYGESFRQPFFSFLVGFNMGKASFPIVLLPNLFLEGWWSNTHCAPVSCEISLDWSLKLYQIRMSFDTDFKVESKVCSFRHLFHGSFEIGHPNSSTIFSFIGESATPPAALLEALGTHLADSFQTSSFSSNRKRGARATQNEFVTCSLTKRKESLEADNKGIIKIGPENWEDVEAMEQGTDPFGMKIDSIPIPKVINDY